MLNHIVLMGRLTRDPELRYTGSNVPVASFSIAVDRDFGRGENGEKQTDFINVSAWRQTGEFVSKYFTKGSMIVVSGRLQIRDYTDRDGNPVTAKNCDVRGAWDKANMERQRAKIVKAINNLGADVVSLEEIENSAKAASSVPASFKGERRDYALATLYVLLYFTPIDA